MCEFVQVETATPTKRQKAQEQSKLKQENNRLSEEKYMGNIVAAITELRREYNLAVLLELVAIPRSTYYYHCQKAKDEDNQHEKGWSSTGSLNSSSAINW